LNIALWTAGLYALTFTLSLALLTAIMVLLPARYFVDEGRWFWSQQPPFFRWAGIIGKNLLGLVIVLLGILLSLPGIPGQGLLTILIGVMLLDIPGKRRLVRGIVRRPGIFQRLNQLRSWFGRPPLVVDTARQVTA